MKLRKKSIKRWLKGVRGIKQMTIDKYEKKKSKKHYAQDWKAYNLTQTNEFVMFQDILVELIDNVIQVRNPFDKVGRPFADLKDMIFCCVMRIYFNKSVRRSTSYLTLAKGKNYIKKIPHFNTILNYYKNPQITLALKQLIEQSGLPLKDVETEFAVDGSGFSTTLYGRWFNARRGKYSRRKLFKKAHVTSGVKTNIISAVEVSEGFHHDSPYFEGLVKVTAKNYNMRVVCADAGYSSRKNHDIVEDLGAVPFIAFPKNVTGHSRGSMMWKKMYRFSQEHREQFLDFYHKRSNAESVFNMLKRKFGTFLRCKTETAQINELLCMCLAHNICVLIQETFEMNSWLNFKDCEKIRLTN